VLLAYGASHQARRWAIVLILAIGATLLASESANANGPVVWSGVLQASADAPISGAEITLQKGSRIESATTDEDGRFEIPFISGPASYALTVPNPTSALDLPELTEIRGQIELSGTIQQNITLPTTAPITVAVSDQDGPIPAAQVLNFERAATKLAVSLGSGLTGTLEAPFLEIPATGSHGEGTAYTYPGMEMSGLLARHIVEGVSITSQTETGFTVPPEGLTLPIVFPRDTPVFWSGTLQTSTLQPIPGAELSMQTPNSIQGVKTDETGRFRVGTLPGQVHFLAEIPNLDGLALPVKTDLTAMLEFEETHEQDITLPSVAPITVTVTNSKGAPVAEAQVFNPERSSTELSVELAGQPSGVLEAPFLEIPATSSDGTGTTYSYPGIKYSGLRARYTEKRRQIELEGNPFTVGIDGTGLQLTTAPTITAITPSSGPAGTSVEIAGKGFSEAKTVKFGKAKATEMTLNSDSSITAIAPKGKATVDITVITKHGRSAPSTTDQFTYAP
jgi:hypothetical protein